jgi:hypothetical protein
MSCSRFSGFPTEVKTCAQSIKSTRGQVDDIARYPWDLSPQSLPRFAFALKFCVTIRHAACFSDIRNYLVMHRRLKLILGAYLLFGTAMSAVVCATPLAKWGVKEVLIMVAIHIPFIAVGAWLAAASKPTQAGYRHGLSPGLWRFALVAGYVIGFIGYTFAK